MPSSLIIMYKNYLVEHCVKTFKVTLDMGLIA